MKHYISTEHQKKIEICEICGKKTDYYAYGDGGIVICGLCLNGEWD